MDGGHVNKYNLRGMGADHLPFPDSARPQSTRISPRCADAYVLLAEEARSIEGGSGLVCKAARGHGALGRTSERDRADCLPTSPSSCRPAIPHAQDRT